LSLILFRDGGRRPDKPICSHLARVEEDRAQRDMLLAAAENTFRGAIPTTFHEDVKWLCDRTTSLEDLRNDALHSPYWGNIIRESEVIVMPNINLGHIRAQKLFPKNILTEFRYCRDSAIFLSKFAWKMDCALSDCTLPWPDKPVLPARRATNAPKPRPQAHKAKRPPPPPPSQA
jgi:hypothetical protein